MLDREAEYLWCSISAIFFDSTCSLCDVWQNIGVIDALLHVYERPTVFLGSLACFSGYIVSDLRLYFAGTCSVCSVVST
jgi:hypothetical protein